MITLVGNCQLHRLQYVLEVQGIMDFEFYANNGRLGTDFDTELVKRKVAEASLVVTQPVMNFRHPLHYKIMLAMNPNIIFVPYMFIDGIFSMSSSAQLGSRAYGQEYVETRLATEGIGAVADDIRRGAVDFANSTRFKRSIAELERREREICHFIMSDYILENFRLHDVMTTHNHPTARMFDVFCNRLFAVLGLPYRSLSSISRYESVVYPFARTPRLFSPYDVEALGLKYPHDDLWFQNCLEMLQGWNDAARAAADVARVVAQAAA